MKHHIAALAEAVRLARQELEHRSGNSHAESADLTLKRLNDLLDSDGVREAIDTLAPHDGIPSIVPEQKVDLRVPYPWRSR